MEDSKFAVLTIVLEMTKESRRNKLFLLLLLLLLFMKGDTEEGVSGCSDLIGRPSSVTKQL